MGDPLRRVLPALAALALVALPATSASGGMTATLDSLRGLDLLAAGALPASEVHVWRAHLDADGSGAVGGEEVAVFTDVLEALVRHADFGPQEAYTVTWASENASGARGFTLDGRANLSSFALGLAPLYRIAASLDGATGALDRIAVTFEGLAGRVAANATVKVTEAVAISWGQHDGSREVHRLEISGPQAIEVSVLLGGSFEVAGTESLLSPFVNRDRTAVHGYLGGAPAVILVKERSVATNAVLVVSLAVVVPALLVSVVTLRTSRGMQVKETPLPVEPRYR